MRGDLASAMLHDPEILYLDEPTIGLDVVAKQRIGDFLRHLNQERALTVLLTTHDMTDIAQRQRMLLIDHGRLLYDGAVAAIRNRFGVERTLVVDLAEMRHPMACSTSNEPFRCGPTVPDAGCAFAMTRLPPPN
jgi:ABC-2 type transport system ATP-binding protein